MTIRPLLDSLHINGRRIRFKAHPHFHSQFLREDFCVEYDRDVCLQCIDPAVLLIPFLLNVLPLVWLSKEVYSVDGLDAELSRALEEIRLTIERLHPQCAWEGRLVAERLSTNGNADRSEETALLFSGGVDSVYTSLSHQPEHPLLIRILNAGGSNHPTQQTQDAIRAATRFHAEAIGAQSAFVLANLASFISQRKLVGKWPRPQRWLIEMQHGLGFVGLAAPVMHSRRINRLLMAGCELDHYGLPSGSHPDIINAIRWSTSTVFADGIEQRRQEKLRFLIHHTSTQRGLSIALRPCLRPAEDYSNCCTCSKCLQTLLGIVGERGDPRKFGFKLSLRSALRILRRQMKTRRLLLADLGELHQWMDIQSAIRAVFAGEDVQETTLAKNEIDLLWFVQADFPCYFARTQSRGHQMLRSIRTRIALSLQAYPLSGRCLRILLRPFLQWR